MKPCRIPLALTLTAVLGPAFSAYAEETNLGSELARVAGIVKDVLHKDGIQAVAVRDFRDLSQRRANAGPGLEAILQTKLTKLGLTIDPEADHIVTADYTDMEDPETGLLVVSVTVK